MHGKAGCRIKPFVPLAKAPGDDFVGGAAGRGFWGCILHKGPQVFEFFGLCRIYRLRSSSFGHRTFMVSKALNGCNLWPMARLIKEKNALRFWSCDF